MIDSKFAFAFYIFINSSNCKKQSYIGYNLLYLPKERPKTNLEVF